MGKDYKDVILTGLLSASHSIPSFFSLSSMMKVFQKYSIYGFYASPHGSF